MSIFLGEFMQNSIKRNQECLRSRVNFLCLQGKCPNSWETCCSEFTEWKWTLTARNIFSVNHSLITRVMLH
ncbi:unnamed protein product [Allacma fusca]|uniref:Uncharacterized protein n=1 Tax=Allacma fusca TaxID=39272 RepID=A0A8J2KL64_9HEXA|nr:unnamed protein product [Allacma fusca]